MLGIRLYLNQLKVTCSNVEADVVSIQNNDLELE